MKQISARQFRTSFADLTEPVTVLRRNDNANFDVLGVWTPATVIDKSDVFPPTPTALTPWPKPSKRGKS